MCKWKSNGSSSSKIRCSMMLQILVAAFFLCTTTHSVLANAGPHQEAAIVTAAPDFSSGAHAIASVDPVDGPRSVLFDLNPTISDLTAAAYGYYFYVLERYQADNVSKYPIDTPTTRLWQCSTLDSGETTSNPHDLIFAGSKKAYLTRYDQTKLWIVNPSASTCSGFKIGEINLLAFADADGIPEMDKGVIVGTKLFITVQRLDQNSGFIPLTAYLAVIDVETDTIIDPGIPNPDNVPGIPLPAKNPSTIQFLPDNGILYVQCAGSFFPQEFTGGIVAVDPDTYSTTLVFDDSATYGNVLDIAILSASKGYFIGYAAYGDNTLYSLNPTTGTVLKSGVAGLSNTGLFGGLNIDKNNMLWAGAEGELIVINSTSDTQNETLNTDLNPLRTAFCTYFTDVPSDYWAFDNIQKLYAGRITTGCAEGLYCTEDYTKRSEMSVFLIRAKRGPAFQPPTAVGIFADVPVDYWAADWIEQLYNDGITQGCDTDPLLYCPEQPVTRADMAVFLLRAEHGADYEPPAPVGIFADVPVDYWAAAWMEELYNEGISTGCAQDPLSYCPEDPVKRSEMAAFLDRTFDL